MSTEPLFSAIANIPSPATMVSTMASENDRADTVIAIDYLSNALKAYASSARGGQLLDIDIRTLNLTPSVVFAVTKAFREKGYSITYRAERGPNGVREFNLTWS